MSAEPTAESSLPNTQSADATPALDAGVSGIALVGPGARRLGDACVVHGAFRVAEETRGRLDAELHRAVTVAVTSRYENWTIDPFRLAMLFEDDLHADPGGVRGAFALDLSAYRAFRYPGTYYVTASIGPHVSSTLVVEVS